MKFSIGQQGKYLRCNDIFYWVTGKILKMFAYRFVLTPLGIGMNTFVCVPNNGQIASQVGFFSFGSATSLGNGNSEFKTKCKISKLADCSRRQLEGSLFNSYYADV